MLENYIFKKYDKKYNQEIINLWNSEIGFIFKLDYDSFTQKVNNKYLAKDASYLCFEGEKLVGFIISKVYDNNPIIPKYINKGWISLIYVGFKYRKQGIGNYLLDIAEKNLKKIGVNSISVGSDLENFFPGIPADFDNLTDVFFKNRGYNVGRYTHDLIKHINENDLLINDNCKKIEFNGKEEVIEFKYASIKDKEKTLEFLEKCFFGRWYAECKEYFDDNDIVSEYLIALHNDKVIGFLRVNFGLIKKVSYNNTWKNNFEKLVGIGPLGIDPEYRKHGIAKHLLLKSTSDAYKMGYKEAMIDWTGLMHIYQKYGYQVWKCYSYTSKDLN